MASRAYLSTWHTLIGKFFLRRPALYILRREIMKIILVVSIFIILMLTTEAKVNFKRRYCGNYEYIGNPGSRYPHLHCGKRFLTLSISSNQHHNLQGHCNKVNEILGNPQYYYGNAGNPGAITTVLNDYKNDRCPTLFFQD